MTDRLVCFVHIPKTAGSAMRAAMTRMVDDRERLYWLGIDGSIDDLAASLADGARRYTIIGGHSDVVAFEKLPNLQSERTYVAVVRDPVERVISLYQYIVAGGDAYHPLREELRELGLRRALDESERFRWDIVNAQCRYLSGEPTFAAAEASLRRRDWICGTADAPQRVLNRVGRYLGTRSPSLVPENIGEPGYFERLATPDVVGRIAELTVEDRALNDFVKAEGIDSRAGWLTALRRRLGATR